MNSNDLDVQKCSKCERILTNANQLKCGCQFCHICLNELLGSGCQFCPGYTDKCKETFLTSFDIDGAMPEFIMRCPLEEREPVNMNEHLQSDTHKPSLTEIIYSLRNEMDRLNENDARTRTEIEILKEENKSLKEEINLIKTELSERIENTEAPLEHHKFEDGSTDIESINEQIKLIKEGKIDKSEILITIARIDRRVSEIRQEWKGALNNSEAAMKEIIAKYQAGTDQRINAADKWVEKKISGAFVWVIDKILERRMNDEIIMSEYFYGKMQPYNMALKMYVNGIAKVAGIGLIIWLHVYDDMRNKHLEWPWQADITIKIVNRTTPDVCKMVTKHCKFNKPEENSYEFSDPFNFMYSDLVNDSLLEGNCLIVECYVGL